MARYTFPPFPTITHLFVGDTRYPRLKIAFAKPMDATEALA